MSLRIVSDVEDPAEAAQWEAAARDRQEQLKREAEENLRAAKRAAVARLGLPKKDIDRIRAKRISRTDAVAKLEADCAIVVLSGQPGRGKTTAAACWLYDWATADASWDLEAEGGPRLRGGDGLFITAAEIAEVVRDKPALKRSLYTAARMVVDDLGVEYLDAGGWFTALFDGFMNKRYAECRPTVFTTNLTAEQFAARYGERLCRRIREAGKFMTVGGPDLSCTP